MNQDYTEYSLSDLLDAQRTVDAVRYPEARAAIDAEIDRRKESGVYDEEMETLKLREQDRTGKRYRFAQNAVPFIAWYLILSGAFLAVSLLVAPPGVSSVMDLLPIGIVSVYVLASVAAGVALLKRNQLGAVFATWMLAMQIVKVTSTPVTIMFTSGLAIIFKVEADWTIGFAGHVGPAAMLLLNMPQSFSIGIDFIPAWLIHLVAIASGWTAHARIARAEPSTNASV
jgi:hypothetical protein